MKATAFCVIIEKCSWGRSMTISLMSPFLKVVSIHPEVLEILVELGFKPLTNPIMRNTIGRKVSLKQGSKLWTHHYHDIGSEWLWSGNRLMVKTNELKFKLICMDFALWYSRNVQEQFNKHFTGVSVIEILWSTNWWTADMQPLRMLCRFVMFMRIF